MNSNGSWFSVFSRRLAILAGKAGTFMLALWMIVIWAVTGPIFHYSDTWQLIINTSTTIITFLMVFLIQNTQNRDTEAMHLKLDELIRSTAGANNALLDMEQMEEEELRKVLLRYEALAVAARKHLQAGTLDTELRGEDAGEGKERSG